MLIVGDVVDIAKVSSLNNLPVTNKDDVIIKFVNLGVSELYRRFNMAIKVETVITTPLKTLYELNSKDVSLMLSVYNSRQEELRQTDIIDGNYDYKIMNYRSFILSSPREELLFVVYKASPPKLTSLDDEIDMPDSMIDALLMYVGYMGHSTINKDNTNESNLYYQRFELACSSLENQGYRIPLNTETINLILKGYR